MKASSRKSLVPALGMLTAALGATMSAFICLWIMPLPARSASPTCCASPQRTPANAGGEERPVPEECPWHRLAVMRYVPMNGSAKLADAGILIAFLLFVALTPGLLFRAEEWLLPVLRAQRPRGRGAGPPLFILNGVLRR